MGTAGCHGSPEMKRNGDKRRSGLVAWNKGERKGAAEAILFVQWGGLCNSRFGERENDQTRWN